MAGRDTPAVTWCLVTDRRRLAGAAASAANAMALLEAQLERAVAAAVNLIQIRERDLDAADLAALVVRVVAMTRQTRTQVVVNDRLDVALASGADGVHLRGDSIPVAEARRLAPPGFLVGRSVHRLDEVDAASNADYLIAGTVFPTASKPAGATLLGLEGLAAVVQASKAPVLAIGGVTADRVPAIAATGAAGVAAIALFIENGCRPV